MNCHLNLIPPAVRFQNNIFINTTIQNAILIDNMFHEGTDISRNGLTLSPTNNYDSVQAIISEAALESWEVLVGPCCAQDQNLQH